MALAPSTACPCSRTEARHSRYRVPVCGGSCWEGHDAPDPEARTLRTVAAALAGEWGEVMGQYGPMSGLPLFAAWGFEDVGVFFDFASLYQNKPQPRTAEQDAAFKRALGGMSMWYALKP